MPHAEQAIAAAEATVPGPATAAPEGRPLRLYLIAILVALFAALPAYYCYSAQGNTNPDAFIYAQTAKEVLAGRRLYSETWLDNPPVGILIYALPQLVIPRSYLAIAFFGGLCVAFTTGMYVYVFRHSLPAMLAIALFLAFFPATNWAYMWPSTEMFSNVFVAGCLLIGVTIHRSGRFSIRQCLVAGALACVAFHIRQNTVLCLIPPGIAVLQSEGQLRDKVAGWAAMFIGALGTWGSILAGVAWLGDLRMYFWTVFVYPRAYSATGSAEELMRTLTFCWEGPLPAIMGMAACLAVHGRRDLLFVLPTALVGLVVVVAPMHEYWHYWVSIFPYAAIMIGLALEHLDAVAKRVAWTLTAALVFWVVPALVFRYYTRNTVAYDFLVRVTEKIDQLDPQKGSLLVCGRFIGEPIQFFSRRPPANMHEWTFHLTPPWDSILPTPVDEIIAEYLASPPDVIVVLTELDVKAAEPSADDLTGDLRLIRALRRRYYYRNVAVEGPLTIALLTKDRSPTTKASQPRGANHVNGGWSAFEAVGSDRRVYAGCLTAEVGRTFTTRDLMLTLQ